MMATRMVTLLGIGAAAALGDATSVVHPLLPLGIESLASICGPEVSSGCCTAWNEVALQLSRLLTEEGRVELAQDRHLKSPLYKAIEMVDSTAKLPAGLITQVITAIGSAGGKRTTAAILGNYQLCTDLPDDYSEYYSMDVLFDVKSNGVVKSAKLRYGVCVPAQCTPEDMQYIAPSVLLAVRQFFEEIFGSTLADLTVGDVYDAPRRLKIDGWGIASIICLTLLVALQIFGTAYDMWYEEKQKPKFSDDQATLINASNVAVMNAKAGGGASDSELANDSHMFTPKKKTLPKLVKFAKCFSLYNNAPKLLSLKRSASAVPSLDGIRFLSMSYVIFGHTYMWSIGLPGQTNPGRVIFQYGTYEDQLIACTVFAVDSFFLLSGFLTCLSTMKVLDDRKGKFPWLPYYVYRFIRLTPAYFFVMLFYVGFEPLTGNGPLWKEFVEAGSGKCHSYWWANLLYINNIYPQQKLETDGCMGWTWYLANDMQFHIISAFLLVPLYRSRKLGWGIILALLTACAIASGILNDYYNLYADYEAHAVDYAVAPKAPLHGGSTWEEYIRPYNRIGPYLLGILLADIFRNIPKEKKKLNFWIGQAVILAAIANIGFLFLIGARDDLTLSFSDFFNSCSRIMWSVGLGGIIYVCHRGAGGFVNTLLSFPIFLPLGRVTFSAYLLHPVLLNIVWYTQSGNTYEGDFPIVLKYMGVLMMSMLGAFAITLLIESPLINLTKLIF